MDIFNASELKQFPPLLDIATTARLLHSTRQHIYNQIRDGHIKCVRVGRKILIPRDPLLKFMLNDSFKEGD